MRPAAVFLLDFQSTQIRFLLRRYAIALNGFLNSLIMRESVKPPLLQIGQHGVILLLQAPLQKYHAAIIWI